LLALAVETIEPPIIEALPASVEDSQDIDTGNTGVSPALRATARAWS
jgi:hypothetical protein